MKTSKQTKKIVLIISVIFIILLLAGLSYNAFELYKQAPYLFNRTYRKAPELSKYIPKSGEFSLLYPSVLKYFEYQSGAHGDNDIITIITNEFEYNIIIIYKHNFPRNDKIELINWGKEKTKNLDEVNEISLIDYFSGSYKGYLREYSIKSNKFYDKRDDHCYDWLGFIDGNGYNFSFCVEQKFWDLSKDVFIEMINSIKFQQ